MERYHFFCSAVRFFAAKRGAVGVKVVDVVEKVGCFRPKTVDFSAKVHCFFLSLGRKGTPPAPFGTKSARSRAKWGCAAMLSRTGVHRRAHI